MEEKIEQILYKSNIIQPLKGFCNTIQEGSISRAAEKMYLTQSTVTKQIQSLERDLQTKLFDRNGHHVVPTKEGKLLYELILPKLQAFENLFEKFLQRKGEETGDVINIAAHHIALSHILPRYIKKFQDKYAKTKIILHNIPREEATEKLREGKIDFTFYPAGDVPIEFFFDSIFKYDPVIIMHRDHPLSKKEEGKITFNDFAKYNFLHLGGGMTVGLFQEIIKEYNIKGNIELYNGSWEILKGLVKENIGISGVSSIYITKNETDIVSKKISHLLPKMDYGIMIMKTRQPSEITKNFIKIMDNKFFDNYKYYSH